MYNEDEIFEYLEKLKDTGNNSNKDYIDMLKWRFKMDQSESSHFLSTWKLSKMKPHCKDCE